MAVYSSYFDILSYRLVSKIWSFFTSVDQRASDNKETEFMKHISLL